MTPKNYKKAALLLLVSLPALAACSTVIEGSSQQIAFKTVGAEDTTCDVQIGKNNYRYTVYPPQTVLIQKSKEPMFITCSAQGNRTQSKTVESSVAGTTFLNTLSAGTTATIDATSGAMFKYPDEVTIDFTTTVARDQPLPSYENAGALDPKKQPIEYMGPKTYALEGDQALRDRYQKAYEDAAAADEAAAAAEAEKQRRMDAVEGGFFGDKGKDTTSPKAEPAKNNDANSDKKPVSGIELAPLSEAVPDSVKGTVATDAPVKTVTSQPQYNHQLAKPIFPSSTSF